MNPADLVASIRSRHTATQDTVNPQWFWCRECRTWTKEPCDALRAADEIERLMAPEDERLMAISVALAEHWLYRIDHYGEHQVIARCTCNWSSPMGTDRGAIWMHIKHALREAAPTP